MFVMRYYNTIIMNSPKVNLSKKITTAKQLHDLVSNNDHVLIFNSAVVFVLNNGVYTTHEISIRLYNTICKAQVNWPSGIERIIIDKLTELLQKEN